MHWFRYTLLLSHSGLTAMPGLYRKLSFDPVADFDGVITAVSGLYVLAVSPGCRAMDESHPRSRH